MRSNDSEYDRTGIGPPESNVVWASGLECTRVVRPTTGAGSPPRGGNTSPLTRQESGDRQPSQTKQTLASSSACSVVGRSHHEGEPDSVTRNVTDGPGNGTAGDEDKSK